VPQSPQRDVVAVPLTVVRGVLAVIVTVVLIAGIGAFTWEHRERIFGHDPASEIQSVAYQSIFLISGATYFGRLAIQGDTYLLRDVFYLSAAPEAGERGQLVKRGNELQGPVEPMVIPARSVLFWENMRDDSDVVATIRLYKSGQVPALPAPSLRPTASATPQPSATR
jgi:hypothetical protein